MEVTKTQASEAKQYKANPKCKGGFLPNLSSKGPYNNCPAEMPIKKLDKESETSAIVVFRSLAMAGKPGKYISMEKGPRAVRVPRMRIRNTYLF